MGVAGDVRIAEGDVDRVLGDGRSIHGKIGFLVSSLVYAETEVMPPQFVAGVSIEAERQQRFSCRLLPLGR